MDLIALSSLAVLVIIAVILGFGVWHLKLMNETNAMTRRAELVMIREAVQSRPEQRHPVPEMV